MRRISLPSAFSGQHPLDRLRRLLAASLLLLTAIVVTAWWWKQHRATARPAIMPLPLTLTRGVHGIVISSSPDGHLAFRLAAQNVVTMRGNNRDELRQVHLDLYDTQGKPAAAITAERIAYDPQSGLATAPGAVQVSFGGSAAQAALQITAHDLRFSTAAQVGTISQGLSFRYLRAQGTAESAEIRSKEKRLVLNGRVRLAWDRPGLQTIHVRCDSARFNRASGWITLWGKPATVEAGTRNLSAPVLRLHVGPDNRMDRAEAGDGVLLSAQSAGHRYEARAPAATAMLRPAQRAATAATVAPAASAVRRKKPETVSAGLLHQSVELASLVLDGGARLQDRMGAQSRSLRAQRLRFSFGPGNHLRRLAAEGGATLHERVAASHASESWLRAPQLDFEFAPGPKFARSAGSPSGLPAPALVRAVATGASRIDLRAPGEAIQVQGLGMSLRFGPHQQPQIANLRGAVAVQQRLTTPAGVVARHAQADWARIVFAPTAGRPLAMSGRQTAAPLQQMGSEIRMLDAGGAVTLQQSGPAAAMVHLRADHLHLDGRNQMARLTATPSSSFTHGLVMGESLAGPNRGRFAAPTVAIDLLRRRLSASGGVQVSLPPPGPTPGKAAAESPVEVTARSLQSDQSTGQAVFTGAVRLWHGADLIQADVLQVDRRQMTIAARGHVRCSFLAPASTVPASALAGRAAKPAGPMPVTISAPRLYYDNRRRQAIYTGGVLMTTPLGRLSAHRLLVDLAPAAARTTALLPATGLIERAVFSGAVLIEQPGRTARAERAVYALPQDLITLSGGPPSISDAEYGYLTGNLLTFSPSTDTIRVESGPQGRLTFRSRATP